MLGVGVVRNNLARIYIVSRSFRPTTTFIRTSPYYFPIENLNQVTVLSKNYPANFTLAASSLLTYLGLTKKDDFEEFQEVVEKGEKALQEKNFKLAEQLFHEALNIARTQLKNESEVTRIYDRLAEVAFDSGNYKSARKLYSSLMERLLSNGVEQNDLRILNLSLKLARTMEQLRKYSEAELGYRFCINGIQTHLTVNNPNLYKVQEFLLMLFMSYAYFHYDRGLLNKALEYFHQAYEVCVRTRGEDYPLTVLILNNLGLVYRSKGDNETALRYFHDAEKLGKKFPDSNDMAYVHLNLGYLRLEQDMLMEARRHCKQALKQSKRTGDEEGKRGSKECLAEVRKALFSRIYSKVS